MYNLNSDVISVFLLFYDKSLFTVNSLSVYQFNQLEKPMLYFSHLTLLLKLMPPTWFLLARTISVFVCYPIIHWDCVILIRGAVSLRKEVPSTFVSCAFFRDKYTHRVVPHIFLQKVLSNSFLPIKLKNSFNLHIYKSWPNLFVFFYHLVSFMLH